MHGSRSARGASPNFMLSSPSLPAHLPPSLLHLTYSTEALTMLCPSVHAGGWLAGLGGRRALLAHARSDEHFTARFPSLLSLPLLLACCIGGHSMLCALLQVYKQGGWRARGLQDRGEGWSNLLVHTYTTSHLNFHGYERFENARYRIANSQNVLRIAAMKASSVMRLLRSQGESAFLT